nr:MAG TPA: hypothetical protein [Caudoviricetes sp.]
MSWHKAVPRKGDVSRNAQVVLKEQKPFTC